MQPGNPSTAPSPATSAASTLVRHFPADVRAAYARFEESHSSDDADIVVLAIVLDHMPDKKLRPAGNPGDQLSLIADLGFDSIAITEMVFFFEDLFRVRITNDEIVSVRTVGELRKFLRQKLAAAAAPAASA